ncbi:hypothetical protein DAI22_08g075400 [Oryza sativa Japonica Group]|nr:hypothetical protein DAI22_08g075400 [Oryza sativa Japonica Group]
MAQQRLAGHIIHSISRFSPLTLLPDGGASRRPAASSRLRMNPRSSRRIQIRRAYSPRHRRRRRRRPGGAKLQLRPPARSTGAPRRRALRGEQVRLASTPRPVRDGALRLGLNPSRNGVLSHLADFEIGRPLYKLWLILLCCLPGGTHPD